MILFRAFPWDAAAQHPQRGGALWFPRMLQSRGRHDAPDRYGCLYASQVEISVVVETLARLRPPFEPADLLVRGLPLALAALELPDDAELVDLDDPQVLVRERLRPSRVATGDRETTQADALALFHRRRRAAGLRWWSTLEASWPNVTLYDRAQPRLGVADVRRLDVADPVVRGASAFLALAG